MDNETFHSCTNWWTRPLLHAILYRSWSAGGGNGGGGASQAVSSGQSQNRQVLSFQTILVSDLSILHPIVIDY